MKLLYTPIRDYVHTAEAVVNYAGLRDRIEPVPTRPFGDDPGELGVNPLGKVPTLVVDDPDMHGGYLAGGPVIYEYLDSLHARDPLYPPGGARRYEVLRRAWMADGLFDTFVLLIIESWRERAEQRADYVERCWSKIVAILDRMERDALEYDGPDIALYRNVGALSFLDLKMGQVGGDLGGVDGGYDWRHGRERLAAWYEEASRHPDFRRPLLEQD